MEEIHHANATVSIRAFVLLLHHFPFNQRLQQSHDIPVVWSRSIGGYDGNVRRFLLQSLHQEKIFDLMNFLHPLNVFRSAES